MPFFSKNVDKLIGDLSYPIYLTHWQIGMVLSYLLFNEVILGLHVNGVILIVLTIFFSVILGHIAVKIIDEPINQLRKYLRKLTAQIAQ